MVGQSSSQSQSYQSAYQNIAQYYRGSCSFSCSNLINDLSVIIEDTTITGGIKIEQNCNVDGSCLLTNMTDATASVAQAAQNSAGASNAGSWLSPMNIDFSSSTSFQDMRQMINQGISQSCKFSSNNQMDNVVVFASNSGIQGGILISQVGETAGSCTLQDAMYATATATQQATDSAQSGKKAKTSGQWAGMLGVGVGVIIVIVIIVAIVRHFMCQGDGGATYPSLCGTKKTKPQQRGRRTPPLRSGVGRGVDRGGDGGGRGGGVQNFIIAGDDGNVPAIITQIQNPQLQEPPQRPPPRKKSSVPPSQIKLQDQYPNFEDSDMAKQLGFGTRSGDVVVEESFT